MQRTAKQLYLLFGLGAICIIFLGANLYGRDKRVLTDISKEIDERAEELYGVTETPIGLIEEYEKQNEEMARRVGEETPNYPRKDHIYKGGLWEYVKNAIYNKWIEQRDTQKDIEDAVLTEREKQATKVGEFVKKGVDKVDKKFEEIKVDAKEKIKEGVKEVLNDVKLIAKQKLGMKDEESLDEEVPGESQSTWESLSEKLEERIDNLKENAKELTKEEIDDIADKVGKLKEIKEDLKYESKGILNLAAEKVDKKFEEVKEGAKDTLKKSIKKSNDNLDDIKHGIKDLKESVTKVPVDKKLEDLVELKDTLDKKSSGITGAAMNKMNKKFDEVKDFAKGHIKEGLKSAAEGAKNVFKDTINRMKQNKEESHSQEESFQNSQFEVGVQSENSGEASVDIKISKPKKQEYRILDEYAVL
jgi:hypothetical protein